MVTQIWEAMLKHWMTESRTGKCGIVGQKKKNEILLKLILNFRRNIQRINWTCTKWQIMFYQ